MLFFRVTCFVGVAGKWEAQKFRQFLTPILKKKPCLVCIDQIFQIFLHILAHCAAKGLHLFWLPWGHHLGIRDGKGLSCTEVRKRHHPASPLKNQLVNLALSFIVNKSHSLFGNLLENHHQHPCRMRFPSPRLLFQLVGIPGGDIENPWLHSTHTSMS